MTQKIKIDGERKALLRRVDAGNFQFVGLLARSKWAGHKATAGEILVTQRALMGATLHVESLKGQLPTQGTIIPVALLKQRRGQTRSGRQMQAHLDTITTQRREERSYARLLQGAKKVIL